MKPAVAPAALALLLVANTVSAQPCTARPNAVVADLGMHVVNVGYRF